MTIKEKDADVQKPKAKVNLVRPLGVAAIVVALAAMHHSMFAPEPTDHYAGYTGEHYSDCDGGMPGIENVDFIGPKQHLQLSKPPSTESI